MKTFSMIDILKRSTPKRESDKTNQLILKKKHSDCTFASILMCRYSKIKFSQNSKALIWSNCFEICVYNTYTILYYIWSTLRTVSLNVSAFD